MQPEEKQKFENELVAALEILQEETGLTIPQIQAIHDFTELGKGGIQAEDISNHMHYKHVFFDVYQHILDFSFMRLPGAPFSFVLDEKSTLTGEEKFKQVFVKCSCDLFTPDLLRKGNKARDSVVFCHDYNNSEERFGIVNPTMFHDATDECKYIANSKNCTLRRLYRGKSIKRMTMTEIYDFTKELLKIAIKKYDTVSEKIYSVMHPYAKELPKHYGHRKGVFVMAPGMNLFGNDNKSPHPVYG